MVLLALLFGTLYIGFQFGFKTGVVSYNLALISMGAPSGLRTQGSVGAIRFKNQITLQLLQGN